MRRIPLIASIGTIAPIANMGILGVMGRNTARHLPQHSDRLPIWQVLVISGSASPDSATLT